MTVIQRYAFVCMRVCGKDAGGMDGVDCVSGVDVDRLWTLHGAWVVLVVVLGGQMAFLVNFAHSRTALNIVVLCRGVLG